MIKFIFVAIIFIILNISCSYKVKTTDLFPLEIGNRWFYEEYHPFPINEDDRFLEYEESIVADTLINNLRYFLIAKDNFFFGQVNINKEDGYYVNNLNSINEKEDIYKFKYPCQVNDTWFILEDEFYTDRKSIFTVKSLNKMLKVNRRKFKCIEYEVIKIISNKTGDSLYLKDNYFISQGIGLIKLHRYFKRNNINNYLTYNTVTLKDFDLN